MPLRVTEDEIVAAGGAEIVAAAGFGGITVTEAAALGALVTAAVMVWVAVRLWTPTPRLTTICQMPPETVAVPTTVEPS